MPGRSESVVDMPVVAPQRVLSEFTLKALLLGLLLSMLLAAANAYIGLLVGMTVSASIPAAALSMGVLRLFKQSNILENNMVQTAASAGEALVAGIIFTIPALVMMGAWDHYDYWPLVAIGSIGGLLGVAFTIPLRRALICEAKLAFPEGVATAQVLQTGGVETGQHTQADAQATRGLQRLLLAGGLGAAFKLLSSGFGLLAGGVAATRAWFGGRYLFTGDITLSPALLGVGYIVGLNIAALVFLGGVIGTVIGVPVNWMLHGAAIMQAVGIDPGTDFSQIDASQWLALAGESWSNNRRIGVGAMMVGGVWSLISLARPMLSGIRSSIAVYRDSAKGEADRVPRTERDTPIHWVAWVAVLAMIPVFSMFYIALGDFPGKGMISALMTLMMLLFGFLFSSVAGYMAGLVGSSNNPISGVTIATVITSALILLQWMGNQGLAATLGPIMVIFLAGLICSSAAIAGDNMQDLKCGHMLGATPWRQQVFQVLGVFAAALVIPLVLEVLDKGYGIGRPSPANPNGAFLSAPQAGLMRDLATGIFGAGIDWGYVFTGFALGVALIVVDEIQSRRGSSIRFPVLAVAVGIYLPLGLSVPILIGGLLAHAVELRSRSVSKAVRESRKSAGLLLASGLITGAALMGVALAVFAAFVMPLPAPWAWGGVLGLVALASVAVFLYRGTVSAS